MPPDNIPKVSPAPIPAPPPQADPGVIDTTRTNQAGAVFFVLLIVGFTFRLPWLLSLPIVFFSIAAGIIFFKDVLDARSKPVITSTAAPIGQVPPKPRSLFRTILLVLFCLFGAVGILFVGFIALVIILFSTSGGFG